MSSRPVVFQFVIFLTVALSPSGCMFTWEPFSSIRIGFKILSPLSHPIVDMASPILPLFVGIIFFSCFRTSSFIYIVWSCVGIVLVFLLSVVFSGRSPQAFSVSNENFLMCRFSVLDCCRSLSICDSSLRSHPSFDIVFVVFKGNPVFSQTNFAPAFIKSFNSVMSFVGICK